MRTVAYGCALEPPPVRWAAFALRTADDRPLALEGTRAVEAAAMVRHAIGRAARAAGLDSRLVSELMGHGGEHRIRVAPLPTVGHRHADGWIRRVMLTAPMGVPGDAWTDVVARLAGAPLVREHARGAAGVLAPLNSGDAVLRRFRAEARRWTTATPVVLPGCDHRRGRARPHRALARVLRHARSRRGARRLRDARARASPRGQRFCAPLSAPAPPRPLPRRAPLGDVAHHPRRPPRARRRAPATASDCSCPRPIERAIPRASAGVTFKHGRAHQHGPLRCVPSLGKSRGDLAPRHAWTPLPVRRITLRERQRARHRSAPLVCDAGHTPATPSR